MHHPGMILGELTSWMLTHVKWIQGKWWSQRAEQCSLVYRFKLNLVTSETDYLKMVWVLKCRFQKIDFAFISSSRDWWNIWRHSGQQPTYDQEEKSAFDDSVSAPPPHPGHRRFHSHRLDLIRFELDGAADCSSSIFQPPAEPQQHQKQQRRREPGDRNKVFQQEGAEGKGAFLTKLLLCAIYNVQCDR